jgi:tetratricopeptide (TPR) repeat protein
MNLQDLYTEAVEDANSGQYEDAIRNFELILTHEMGADDKANVCALLGGLYLMVGNNEQGVRTLEEALAVESNNAAGWSNLSEGLRRLGRLDEAVEASRRAITLMSDDADAYNNLGIALQDQGNLDDAITSWRKSLSLNPDHAEVYNNMGIALQDLGELDDAIASFRKALSLKPDFAEAHNNLGSALQDQGKLDDAITSYGKALSLNPNYADCHNNLSGLKTFSEEDEQFIQMKNMYLDIDLTEDQRCNLCFALAKASEDLNELEMSFKYLAEGNLLRKNLLSYNVSQDIKLFDQIKNTQLSLENNVVKNIKTSDKPTPIFIVGMPRSGTSLVDQIISSHSDVTGAGELIYVEQFGGTIATGISKADTENLVDYREKYLEKLQHISNGSPLVTDKMPLNFMYIGLIYSAFPEAKIVHVKRNPAATCWGNFKQKFSSKYFSYCYNLDDLVTYYGLYRGLMQFWEEQYGDRIYNLNYEALTMNQEDETRKLIQYLGLEWQEACLSPQDNKRSVGTASNKQIRQKIYQGSSQEWKKFEPFLNGAFNNLGD